MMWALAPGVRFLKAAASIFETRYQGSYQVPLRSVAIANLGEGNLSVNGDGSTITAPVATPSPYRADH